jgi:hypothetical protein
LLGHEKEHRLHGWPRLLSESGGAFDFSEKPAVQITTKLTH